MAVQNADPVRRIYCEYIEMPGLRLTAAQAQRLWGLEASVCQQALDALVEARFLCCTAAGQYARTTEGAASFPPARMLKAQLEPATTRRIG